MNTFQFLVRLIGGAANRGGFVANPHCESNAR